MLYITLRGCWCDIVRHVHAPTEDKNDDTELNGTYQLVVCTMKKNTGALLGVTGEVGLSK